VCITESVPSQLPPCRRAPVLQCVAACCSVLLCLLQCVASVAVCVLQCQYLPNCHPWCVANMLQCVAVCCSVYYSVSIFPTATMPSGIYVAVCCSVLQCAAVFVAESVAVCGCALLCVAA